MLIIDKLRQRDSKEPLAFRRDRVDTGHLESRKIIDFESARRALERDRSMRQNAEKSKRTFLSNLTDRSSGIVESLVTIVLVVVIGLSLLLGMIWGF
jgi:hypothetical protein